MTTTTIRDLRARMKSIFDNLDDTQDVLLVPRTGDKDPIVIMTLTEYNSIMETEYLLSTEANRKVIGKAIKELDAGEVRELGLGDQ